MTIKRNGEKVILKGGKVSCSCCEEAECCMYPAAALVDGLYTYEDLPDEVLYNDDDRPPTLIQKVPDGSFPGGVVYRWPEDGSDDAGLIFIRINADVETSIWEFGDDAGEGGSLCLIQGDGNLTPGDDLVEDQFADTYTASGVPAPGGGTESVSLSRISLCVWQGVDSCGGPVLLSYDGIASAGPLGTYHWYIGWEEYPFFNLFGCNSDLEAGSAEKTDPQSSPAGSYVNVNVNITVS